MQRDVRDLTQVGDEQTFLRFLRVCAARTGQMLNLSELTRDVDVSVKTAKAWLSILVASFQVALLQPYHTNVTKRLVKTPKLYFLDTGLCAYLTEWSSPATLAAGAMSGAMFETHVFIEILKNWWHRMRKPNLYYYRLLRPSLYLSVLRARLDKTLLRFFLKRGMVKRWFSVKAVEQGAEICAY